MVVTGVMGGGTQRESGGGGYVEENSREEKKEGESCWGQVKAARIQGGD